MQLIQVKSSNISQIGFEVNTKVALNKAPITLLRVVFTSGMTYDFYNVTKETFEEFLNADSVGKYFHTNIKNTYPFEKK